MALVLDEYGGTQGLVTVTDIIEAIVGELELLQPQAVQRPDGSWLMDGLLPIDEFKSFLKIGDDLGEREDQYQTLGGFIMTRLGRVPGEGDRFEWRNLSFEVLDMDGMRVDKVLVKPEQAHAPAENS
jgi:putative hemolysin